MTLGNCHYALQVPLWQIWRADIPIEQIHLPRQGASECAGMVVSVEGAAKSLHLPRLHAQHATPEGVSVEGDFD